MRFSTVALGVNDLDRSLEFYTAGLGFDIDSRPQENLVYLASGETRIALYPAQELAEYAGTSAARPGAVVLAINVDAAEEVDNVVRRALAMGGTSLKAPGPMDWGGHAGTVGDPDGHVWEIVWAG